MIAMFLQRNPIFRNKPVLGSMILRKNIFVDFFQILKIDTFYTPSGGIPWAYNQNKDWIISDTKLRQSNMI